jgi:outer membrane immunogenic protein
MTTHTLTLGFHQARAALGALAVAAVMLVGAGAAQADGGPRARYAQPVYSGASWSGFYVGIQGGGAWGDSEHSVPGITTGSFDLSGGLFGVTWGTNWQSGNVVFGTESDFSFSSIDGDVIAAACGPTTCFTDVRNLSTSRLRLGYAMDRTLVYVTGGLAYGTVRAGVSGTPFEDDKTRFGWALGAGIEWKLDPRWSLKAEYLHVDLGDHSNYSVPGVKIDVDVTTDIVRVGLNYNLGPNFWSNALGLR